MLALTDSALARICIGASRVSRGRRKRWLQEIAARIAIIRSRERLRRARARRKNKTRCYTIEIPDHLAASATQAIASKCNSVASLTRRRTDSELYVEGHPTDR